MPPNPDPAALPLAEPHLANPTVADEEVRITWVGHATFLVQLPGLNLLTDPVWSRRASPVSWRGPARFVPAVPEIDALPPIDAVLLSHDHYDHLDRPTVRALQRRFPDIAWLTPLGYRAWFERQGAQTVVERDWWEEVPLPGGRFRATAVPARHWTRRTPGGTNRRLWCGWTLAPSDGPGCRIYFVGDSGYCSAFQDIGSRLGPFDASLIPIGAYDPRWFMRAAHMNPEEAVQVYHDVGGAGTFVPSHWGTFRLTFEPPLEPLDRVRSAWASAGLPEKNLRVLRHGETTVVKRADAPGQVA